MPQFVQLSLTAFVLLGSASLSGQWLGRPEPPWEKEFQTWIADPDVRVYPGSFGRDSTHRQIDLQACRNEHAIFQLAVRSPQVIDELSVHAIRLLSASGARIAPANFRIRYAGLMPVDEDGQYTPDPLWEVPSVPLKPYQTQGVWVEVQVPPDAAEGLYDGAIEVRDGPVTRARFNIALDVLPARLPDPTEYHYYLNIWFDPASIARFNHLPLWGEEHWRQVEKYVADLAAHGQKTIVTFIVEDPWNSLTGFPVGSTIQWAYAGDWKLGAQNQFALDFSAFDRYVEMSLKAGIRNHIEAWSPLRQPESDTSTIIYTDTESGARRKVDLAAGSEEYKAVWGQFARTFQEHLRQKGWLDKTYLGFDEISSGVLDRIVPFFHTVAPDLKLTLAGGDEKGRYGRESRQIAVNYGQFSPDSGVTLPDQESRRKAEKRTLFYTAVDPLYPNTFLFSKPLESRYMGWFAWKWHFDGYLRWAWNFWPEDLWNQPHYKWHTGDMFFVYPGPDGPVDSIRSEMLRKGIEDYECLWLVRYHLDRLRAAGGHEDVVKRGESSIERAVYLATRQFDREHHSRDPLESRIAEARRIINAVLVEVTHLDR